MSEAPPFEPPGGTSLPERVPFRPVLELLPPAGWVIPPPPAHRPSYARAVFLFLCTLFTTTTLGPVMLLMSRTDIVTDLAPDGFALLGLRLIRRVWTDPALLGLGATFSLTALTILLAHELGHVARHHWQQMGAVYRHWVPGEVTPKLFMVATIRARSRPSAA